MIVALGDSITYGQHLDPEDAWPRLIVGHDIVSAGVPSDTTRLGLERFPKDVQTRGPAGVIIQFGHNDANRWVSDRNLPRVSIAAYEANLAEMVARCRAFGAIPLLCTLTPSRRSPQHAADVQDYDRALRRVASDCRVRIIDVRSLFEGYEAEPDGPQLLLDDGLHLSKAGHRLYAIAVRRVLDEEWP